MDFRHLLRKSVRMVRLAILSVLVFLVVCVLVGISLSVIVKICFHHGGRMYPYDTDKKTLNIAFYKWKGDLPGWPWDAPLEIRINDFLKDNHHLVIQKDENGHDVAAVRSDGSSPQTTATQKKTQRRYFPLGSKNDWHFWIQSQQSPNHILAYATLKRQDLDNEGSSYDILPGKQQEEEKGYGVLYNVTVDKNTRRQGYVGLLLDYIIDTVNNRFSPKERKKFFSQDGNRSKLYLSVDTTNTVAIKAYQKYGFRRTTQGFKQGQYYDGDPKDTTNKNPTYFYMCLDINQPLPSNEHTKKTTKGTRKGVMRS